MALLVSDVRTAFERRKRDISDVSSATFVEWCDFINKFIYERIADQDPERFIETSSYTVSTSPQTSALPADFKNIQTLGTGFYEIDDNGDATSFSLPRTGFGQRTQGFYITGSNVVFTGIDDSTIYTLRYMPKTTKIDATTNYFTVDTLVTGKEIILDEYLELLVNALDVQYTIWDEDPSSESLSDFRFVRALESLLSDIRREPDAYGIPDFSQSF